MPTTQPSMIASSTTDSATTSDPTHVVESFLASLAAKDIASAAELLADDVVYVNVGLPTLRGRKRVAKALAGLSRPSLGFEVYMHAIAADGPVVLTERTDVLILGPLRAQFWVAGRFDVTDGRITLWRDAFDFVDVIRSFARGLLGIFAPALRPSPPALQDPPGR